MQRSDGQHRKKVIFFAESVTLAHMARPVVLAHMLDVSEFEVILARDPRYSPVFNEQGLKTVDLYSIPSSDFLAALARGKPLYSDAVLEQYVEEDLRILDEHKPDIVVGDFRLSLSISARLRDIPYLAIANAYWSPHARLSYTIPEHPLNQWVGVTIAEKLFRMVRPMAFAQHALPLNRVRRKHGLKSLGLNLNRVYTDGDYVLYADIPSLVSMHGMPDNHLFLGPVLWSPEGSYPEWWPEVDRSPSNIYLTLGSSGRNDLLPVVIEALQDLPVQLLVSTAGQGDVRVSATNILTANYLPGEAAAGKSKLVICNGGSLTTYQAFSQGVPVLGIAGNLDQHLNMTAIEERGAGIRLRTDKLNRTNVRQAVLTLLEQETYTERAVKLGEEMAQMDVRQALTHHLRRL